MNRKLSISRRQMRTPWAWILPAALWLILAIGACGAPDRPPRMPADQTDTHAARDMELRRYVLRYQSSGMRVAEISGDSAALIGTDVIRMDSVHLTLYRNNLPAIDVRSPGAIARVGSADSGEISMPHASCDLYFGGTIRMGTLRVSFAESSWAASGPVEFSRPPLEMFSKDAGGPLTLDRINMRSGQVRAEHSIASADRMEIEPLGRTIRLNGRARFESDTQSVRSDSLVVRLDPTFSRLLLAPQSVKVSE